MRVFHASKIPNLKVLKPFISSHGVPYVYGTKSIADAAFFGTSKSWRNFDGIFCYTSDGIIEFSEGYEGALERRFKGEKCYIYEVEPESFFHGTSWKAEVVSKQEVKVLNCIEIQDMYEFLLQLEKEAKVKIIRYNNNKEYKQKIRNYILCHIALIDYYNDDWTQTWNYSVCKEKYYEILNEYNKIKAHEKVYHVSPIPNLKVIDPKISSHGVPYVYATKNFAFGLLFGSDDSWGDLDGIYGVDFMTFGFTGLFQEIVYFKEAYKGAFERRFKGKSCYVYELEPDGFVKGKTSFKAEIVSTKPAKVIKCEKIDDLYGCLNTLIKEEKIKLTYFENTDKYKNMIEEFLLPKIKQLNKKGKRYKICKEKFPYIIEKLEENINKS